MFSMQTFSLLFLFLLLLCDNTYSQVATLRGTIIDDATSAGIPHAIVTIPALKRSVSANSKGEFIVHRLPKGELHIDVRSIGYRPDHIDIVLADTNEPIIIRLRPLPLETPTVVITDRASTSSKLTELQQHDHILHGAELQKELGQTLAATLKNEAGLAVRSMGPAPARPVIRGLSGNRVQINEDGVPAADLSGSSPDHAVAIDPSMMEQVEIIRGPRALIYSPSSIGGVINAIRDDIPRILLHEALYSVAGGYESVLKGGSALVSAEVPIDNVAFKGMAGLRSTNNISAPNGILKNTDIRTEHLSLGGGYIGEDIDFGASGSQFSSEYGIPGGFVGAHPNGVRIEMLKRTYNVRTALHLHGDFADDLKANLARTYYHHVEKESGGAVGAEFRVTTYTGSFDIFQHKNSLFDNGVIGAYFAVKDFEYGGFVFTPKNSTFDFSTYIFEEWHWDKTEIQAAVRFNYSTVTPSEEKQTSIGFIGNRNFSSVSASVSVLQPIAENLFIGGTLTRSNRPPGAEELFSLGPHLAAYSFETGNPTLPNELGHGVELFLNYSDDSLFCSITSFYNQYSSFITPRNSGDTNYATFLPIFSTSAVRARLMGLEGKIKLPIGKGFSCEITSGFTLGDNLDENIPLPMIPPFKTVGEIKYDNGNWNTGLRIETTSDQNRTDIFEQSTSGYSIFGAYFQARFPISTVMNAITITADNIFNTTYRNHLSRIKSIFPEPGTNIRVHWRIFI